MTKIETYTVPPLDEKVRLSDFVVGIFETISTRKGMKKAIIRGQVFINGKRGYSGDYIIGEEVIELYESTVVSNKPILAILITILFEDDYLAIVKKPQGMEVSGNKNWTLENALPLNLQPSSQPDALPRSIPAHRLDYATGGVLLIGKTKNTLLALNKLFEERKIEKTYLAVTIGKMENQGEINLPIDGKNASSTFRVIDKIKSKRYDWLNLVVFCPHTGRRHQLRKHAQSINNPIFGDLKYGIEGKILHGKGLFLHAYKLVFLHPIDNKEISTSNLPPKKFLRLFPNLTETINQHLLSNKSVNK